MLTSKSAAAQTRPLQEFLASLPPEIPQEVRDLLLMASDERGAGLPPRIFLEAVEQLPLAISITDTWANIIYANKAFSQITGYLPEELVDRNESILSNKATPTHVYEDLWATIGGGDVWCGIMVNRKKCGDPYVADLTVVPVKDADQRVAFYVGIHRDVTALHQLEQEVRNQKTLIESVLQAAPVAMVFLDPDGGVVLDNHAYKLLTADLRIAEPAERVLAAVAESKKCDLKEIFDQKIDFSHVEIRIDSGGAASRAGCPAPGPGFTNTTPRRITSFANSVAPACC
ncbi:hypothetical protein JCM17960_07320 [Magnetospira thiophila]